MTPILISLASFIGFVAFAGLLGAAYVIIGACWVAKGSPDVNGDPERDAGVTGTPFED